MTAVRFLSWVLGVVFILGIGDSFVQLTLRMGKAAVEAHMHDQISYSKYNKLLWDQAPSKEKNKK